MLLLFLFIFLGYEKKIGGKKNWNGGEGRGLVWIFQKKYNGKQGGFEQGFLEMEKKEKKYQDLRWLLGGSMSIKGSFWLSESVVVVGCCVGEGWGTGECHFDGFVSCKRYIEKRENILLMGVDKKATVVVL